MSTKLDIACTVLRRNGYDVKTYKKDGNEFFQIAGEDFPGKAKSASAMRHEVCEFQEKYQEYFQLFLPRRLNRSLTVTDPGENFREDLAQVRKRGSSPTPRDIFAAAELLQRCIYVFVFTGTDENDVDAFTGVVYAPVIKHDLSPEQHIMYIMTLDDNSHMIPSFARIVPRRDDDTVIPYPAPVYNIDHKNCYQSRFRNTFLDIQTLSPLGQMSDEKDFFRRLSIEIYGADQYSYMVKKLICNFILEDDNLDVFSKLTDVPNDDSSLDDRRRHVKDHVDKIRLGTKMLGDGELFAAASIFNVSIFVDKNCADQWELYSPLGGTYATTFDSPISFKRQTVDRYMPYVTKARECPCRQGKITVKGKILVAKEDIYRALSKRPCCPSETRHGCHRHFKHIGGSKVEQEVRMLYDHPSDVVQLVLHRLQAEERILDRIVNGSLYHCLAKEVFGDENFMHRQLQSILSQHEDNVDTQLQAAADWLEMPIYLHRSVLAASQRFTWNCFKPVPRTPPRRETGCRYYVALSQNQCLAGFDRIVPREGCNCQLLPPVSILRSEQDPRHNASLVAISKGERHAPMVTFLSEEPDDSLFDVEEREFPPCAPYSETRSLLQRPDMTNRTIDCSLDHSFSMYRCVSKEIFGSENHFDFIVKEVCQEITDNKFDYTVFCNQELLPQKFSLRNMFTSTERITQMRNNELVEKLVHDFEDGLAQDDVQLLALATHFQTPIFVLKMDQDGSSIWTEYTQLRKKPKPRNLDQSGRKSKCKSGKYYITLFRSSAGQYHRIVPDTEVCNCYIREPTIPDRHTENFDGMPINERTVFSAAREVENAISSVKVAVDDWLRCSKSMQTLCDAIVLEVESRRRGVNIATLLGSGAGVGGALVAVGALFAPVTGGASTALVVVGGIVSGLGGITAAGASITEFVLNKGTVERLDRYQRAMKIRSESLQESLEDFLLALKNLDQNIGDFQLNQNLEAFDAAALRAIPNLIRAIKGFAMIPLGVLRVSVRGAVIAGAILGPLAGLVDLGFIAWSAYSLSRGSKTNVSENLRRISAMLRSSRVQMHIWAYGNHIPLMYK